MEYFAQVCEQVAFDPPLPEVTEEEAGRILEVTQGVPLAVKIAAGLYVSTTDMKIVTEKVESKRKIVDQMVRRYLLHTRAEPSELAHLYGLALLRRADQPATIAVALGLIPEQAKISYASELSRLHRRYSFIFTEKEHPSLHQEVRYFLRRWLLEHRTEPEVMAVNERLQNAHQDALKKLEERKQYTSLKERLEDEEWVKVYSDLIDQSFWLDPTEGVEYGLPLMIAASIYRRGANREIARIGKFFEAVIPQPYRKHWVWASQSLIYRTSLNPSREELQGLEELVRLVSEKCPRFQPSFLSMDYQKELGAALWWRFGETYLSKNDNEALKWFEKALTQLEQNGDFCKATAIVASRIASKQYKEEKFFESKTTSSRAIELCPTNSSYYLIRGNAYYKLEDYEQAVIDYNHAIELDSTVGGYFNNRGLTYYKLKNYEQAVIDYNHAIELDSTNGNYYGNRGDVYYELKNYNQAIVDFNHAMRLDSDLEYRGQLNKGKALHFLGRFQEAISAFHKASIAHPAQEECLLWLAKSYMSFESSSGISKTQTENAVMRSQDFEEVFGYFNRIIKSNPSDTKALFNRGETYNLMGYQNEALADFDRALALGKSSNIHYTKKLNNHLKHMRALILSYLKKYAEAIKEFEQLLKEEHSDEIYLYNLAVALARERGIAESKTIIDQAYAGIQKLSGSERRYNKLYGLGGLEALLGHIDQSLDYLEAALFLDEIVLFWARSDVAWLDLHDNVRFQRLIIGGNDLGNIL